MSKIAVRASSLIRRKNEEHKRENRKKGVNLMEDIILRVYLTL